MLNMLFMDLDKKERLKKQAELATLFDTLMEARSSRPTSVALRSSCFFCVVCLSHVLPLSLCCSSSPRTHAPNALLGRLLNQPWACKRARCGCLSRRWTSHGPRRAGPPPRLCVYSLLQLRRYSSVREKSVVRNVVQVSLKCVRARRGTAPSEAELRRAFASYDDDRSGTISSE